MPEELDNSAPAGAEPEIVSPIAFSVDEAAAAFDAEEDENANKQQPEDLQDEQSDEDLDAAADEPTEDVVDGVDDGDAPEDSGEETSSEQSEPVDFDALPDDAVWRLRDGREIPMREVKKTYAEWSELQQQRESFNAEYQQKIAQFKSNAQEAQKLQAMLPAAIQALQQQLPSVPPMPDPSLVDTDALKYMREKAAHDNGVLAYNQKLGEIRQAQAYQAETAHRVEQENIAARNAFVEEQRGELIKQYPELKDPAEMEKLGRELLDTGAHYGFKPDEILGENGVVDARIVRLARDAGLYRKLKANPPKPNAQKPAGQKTAVAKPGKRGGDGDTKRAGLEGLRQRARRSGGSLDDVAALYDAEQNLKD